MARIIVVLALCTLATGHHNYFHHHAPSYNHLNKYSNNLVLPLPNIFTAPPARLPVNGFGFSNPPPPLGSGLSPQELTCGLAPPVCANSRYRSLDGSCNNLYRPTWGMAQTPYGRLTPANYGNGVNSFPLSASGLPLRNPREISLVLYPDKNQIDPIINLNGQQWGQIVTHDMSLTAGVTQSQLGGSDNSTYDVGKNQEPIVCCNDNGMLTPDSATNPSCAPIPIPKNDPVHSPQGTQCMNFVRTGNTLSRGCTPPNVPAQPISVVTSYMDLSLIYGNAQTQSDPIRAYQGGKMLTLKRPGGEWPPQDPNVTVTCETAQSPNEPCYLAGDIRINQNPQLTVLQIILLREHNRVADTLALLNPHWTDETLYQETRRITIAEYQHINYYEYLPLLIGEDNMEQNKLIYKFENGYVNDYNPNVDPSVVLEHATAAFRHFHTLIRGYLQLITEKRNLAGAIRLSDWFNRPLVLELDNGNTFDDLARGLTVQQQDFSDQFFTSEITQFLFKRNNTFGGDLRATDIQRGRDHGLGTYVAAREVCGLPVPTSFDDMLDFISAQNVAALKRLYETPNDVELVVAGVLERSVPGAQVGPTYLCILTEQFYRTRVGDRYFYENGADHVTAFTPSQLASIRHGASMARLLCDNVNSIKLMQPKAFIQINHGNELVPCDSLPAIDLTLWQDVHLPFK